MNIQLERTLLLKLTPELREQYKAIEEERHLLKRIMQQMEERLNCLLLD